MLVFVPDPVSLNFNKKYKIYYIPNPVDEFGNLENYKNSFFSSDVFFAMVMVYTEVY